MAPSVLVIGAGTVGVSTAYAITTSLPNVCVTLQAEQFSPNNTSDVAAGFWRPHLSSDTAIDKVTRWGEDTWNHLAQLAMSPLGSTTGTFFVSGRELSRGDVEDPPWCRTVIGYRRLGPADLHLYPGYTSGYFYTTIISDQTKYLSWMMKQLIDRGVTLKQCKVNDFKELGDYDVIVNCTGMGARTLCHDSSLRAVRGHVVRARAPWIKHFTIAEDDQLHIIPTYDDITMGFTSREDDSSAILLADRERILEGCARLEPSVAAATHHRDWLGFRPVRARVRLEVEQVGGRRVVHNYGHGGSGITLHWGCALEAAQLVRNSINTSKL